MEENVRRFKRIWKEIGKSNKMLETHAKCRKILKNIVKWKNMSEI